MKSFIFIQTKTVFQNKLKLFFAENIFVFQSLQNTISLHLLKYTLAQTMETKSFTQHGKLMYFIFIPLIITNLYLFVQASNNLGGQTKYYAILSLLFLLCLACFNKITITITKTTLSFSMGIGLIKKTYQFQISKVVPL